jgi:hypothetical protein
MVEKKGNLKFFVVDAILTRDTEIIGKMDPFCIINYAQK